MARTIDQIQNEIYQRIANDQTLSTELTSTSKVAIWRLWVYIIAFAIWIHEAIVEENAKNSRVHTLLWYQSQALLFLDGIDLQWENGQFSYPTLIEDIEARKLVKRCAVLENKDGELVIKITGDRNQPLEDNQERRFTTYMNEIKDAGNRLKIVNREADSLKLHLDVYVDTLVIDLDTGQYLETSQTYKPVEDSIENYLNHLEFNGALIKNRLIDAVQEAQGVYDLEIKVLQHRYGELPFTNVGRLIVPDAGHFKIEELVINYHSNSYVAND